MADNWLPSFDMDEQKKLDKGVEEHLSQIAADVAARKRWTAPVTDADRAAHREFLAGVSKMPADAWQHLIRVTDGKAVHIPGNCQTCLSCVHNCPEKAIGLNLPEKNPSARYRNEHIQLSEIIRANQQA